tara:strand:+ start:23 stop:700 length:678 start_codon:yes stop_codon:yes gene_type:complete
MLNIPVNIENFAILLKGKSLEFFPQYKHNFNDCFVVSDYDDELKIIGKHLLGKNIIHFRNRGHESCLTKENYYKFKIKYVQLGQVFRYNHFPLIRSYLYYLFFVRGVNVKFLPEQLRIFNDYFGEEYRLKFPNTGILSIIFALEIFKPKNLWIFGLDFYESDYFTKQIKNPIAHHPLEKRNEKMTRLNLENYVEKIFKEYKNTNIKMCSYYSKWSTLDNMEILNK